MFVQYVLQTKMAVGLVHLSEVNKFYDMLRDLYLVQDSNRLAKHRQVVVYVHVRPVKYKSYKSVMVAGHDQFTG